MWVRFPGSNTTYNLDHVECFYITRDKLNFRYSNESNDSTVLFKSEREAEVAYNHLLQLTSTVDISSDPIQD